jgi:hypothetical protein
MTIPLRDVHEMAFAMFMKSTVGGGDESPTRPPPREVAKMPASGPAFCLEKRTLSDSRRIEAVPKDVIRFAKVP